MTEGSATLVEVERPKDDMEIDFTQAIRAVALFCASQASTTTTVREVLRRAEDYTQFILTGKVSL